MSNGVDTYESGFGSPELNPPTLYKDAGFGDPDEYSMDNGDAGFGSSYDAANVFGVDTAIIGDDGGTAITVYGVFTKFQEYSVTFVRAGQSYLGYNGFTSTLGIYSLDGATLRFYAPLLPLGIYNIEIANDVTQTLLNAVRVVRRNSSRSTCNLRAMMPSFFKAGPVDVWEEEGEYTGLSGLLSSLGSMIEVYAGKPTTYVKQDWSWGVTTLAVGSTLGFDDAGKLNVGDSILGYTGKTSSSFLGVYVISVAKHKIHAREEVIPYVN